MNTERTDLIDKTIAPLPGEELDAHRVLAYLQDAIPGLEGDVQIGKFPGGFSNLTYLVTVGDRELVLRRPPFSKKAKSANKKQMA